VPWHTPPIHIACGFVAASARVKKKAICNLILSTLCGIIAIRPCSRAGLVGLCGISVASLMKNLPNQGFVSDRAGDARALALQSFDAETGPFGSSPKRLQIAQARAGRRGAMGRVLILLAAIPLIAAGYFVRDSDLIARATLYTQAYLLGTGASDVSRGSSAPRTVAQRPLPPAKMRLFREDGKQPRADRTSPAHAAQVVEKRPQVMVASLTPRMQSDAVHEKRARPALNRAAKQGHVTPSAAGQVLLSHASAQAPELDGPPYALSDHAGPEMFMIAHSSYSHFIDHDKFRIDDDADSEPGPIEWPGRLHIDNLKAEDGSSLFGGFTEEEFRARELRCMTAAIYFEARSESRRGQIAVAQVVMNRVRANVYPDTACGVIFQGQWNRNACQFSFACDGKPERANDKARWQEAKTLAREVMRGEHWLNDIGYATHYHATYVQPHWARHFNRVKQIGQHIFYKAPNIRVQLADAQDGS